MKFNHRKTGSTCNSSVSDLGAFKTQDKQDVMTMFLEDKETIQKLYEAVFFGGRHP